MRPIIPIAAAFAAAAIVSSVASGDAATAGPVFSNPARIDNPYMPLTAFTRCELRGRADDGARERSVKTVLPERRRFTIGGKAVDAVTIRDNAYEDGKLVETTLDYYAQADDGTVYYLGESVRNIADGKLKDTKGTWLYGKDTDVLGVAMPADPRLGAQWRFEDVPSITVESNRVEETGLRARAGGRLFTNVIRISEFIQPEGVVEMKLYAPGVGVITEYPPDARVELASCT